MHWRRLVTFQFHLPLEKILIVLDYPAIACTVFRMDTVQGRSGEFMLTCFFFVLLMSIFFSGCLCNESDTISTGQSLFPPQTIISKAGKFELGFFAPGNSSNYYLGIWYKNIPVRTVVWVANRNNPILQSYYSAARLEMSNGYLLLYAMNRIWAFGGTSDATATEAVILDTGNFVLRNASGITWQSFDYPTDTWLPGAKVGFRWYSDIEAKLVSWMNPNDPAYGKFSLGMFNGSELSIRANGAQKLWGSGPWKEGTFASISDYSNFSNSYNFTYVPRDGNVYLTYNVYNESVMSRIVIDYLGRMMHFVWSEARQAWVILMVRPYSCSAYATCGPNTICNINSSPACRCLNGFVPRVKQDWDASDFSNGGCVRMRPLRCAEDKTGFMKVNNTRLPSNPEYLGAGNGACKLVCLSNCSCNAYAYSSGGECLLFMEDLPELESLPNNSAGDELYVKMESMDIEALPGKGKSKVLPVAIVVPIIAAVLISCFCFCYLWPKLKNKGSKGTHQNLLLLDLNSNGPAYNKHTSAGNSHGEEKNNQYELPIFSFSSIASSTNNFSITNKLGEGGFGPVYKGELLNRQFVAVKRLSRKSGQGLEEFRNETELIAKLQHRNLVGILGCCIENDEKILVYEYMPNKSLDFFLFEPNDKELLDWKKRVHIIEGIAQGLLYLHHYSRLRIVHRDLKASNILLDAEMNPKISDFGMARIFGGNDSQANTKRIVGTYGYMSPEYAMEGLFSVKSDVFAFGVLMLEIISGKKNTGFYGSHYLSLLGYAWNMWKHERVLELIDPILEMPASSSSIPLRYIQIGLLCVQENPADRPLTSDIVAMLNNEETALASPQHPAFTVGRTLAKASRKEGKIQLCTINDLTVSDLEAR